MFHVDIDAVASTEGIVDGERLRKYIIATRNIVSLANTLHDQGARDFVDSNKDTCTMLLEGLGFTGDGKAKRGMYCDNVSISSLTELLGVSKAMREALSKLSTRSTAAFVRTELLELALACGDDDEKVIEHQPVDEDFQWESGDSLTNDKSIDDIREGLGINNQDNCCPSFPGFNRWIDPHSIFTPISTDVDSVAFFEECKREDSNILYPRWHQFTGVYRAIYNIFRGLPLLLADEVGLGKSLQSFAIMSVLAWARTVRKEMRKFPGDMGEFFIVVASNISNILFEAKWRWRGLPGNIPNEPFIVVLPATLSSQFAHEHYRFIKQGHLDLVFYDGTNHQPFWKWFDALSPDQRGRLVIIATEKVGVVDFSVPDNELIHRIHRPLLQILQRRSSGQGQVALTNRQSLAIQTRWLIPCITLIAISS